MSLGGTKYCSVSLFYNLNGGPGSLMWSRNIIFFNQLMETFSVSFLASIYDVWYFSIFFFNFFFKRTKGDKTALITQWISYFGRILFLRTTFFFSLLKHIVCSSSPCTVASVGIKVFPQTPSYVSSVCVSWNHLFEWFYYWHILSYGIVRRGY